MQAAAARAQAVPRRRRRDNPTAQPHLLTADDTALLDALPIAIAMMQLIGERRGLLLVTREQKLQRSFGGFQTTGRIQATAQEVGRNLYPESRRRLPFSLGRLAVGQYSVTAKAEIGTPSGFSQSASIDGHWLAGAVKRAFGCAAGRPQPGVQSSPFQSMRCAGGLSVIPSHQTSPSSVSAVLVKMQFLLIVCIAFGLDWPLVPGAPQRDRMGL